ncbi:Flp pilus assembly protein TadG [Pseudomonas syringae pv. syringae]|nr:Flp pilus assembly protein TadG [Pseudomonas syringae pv. syringae]
MCDGVIEGVLMSALDGYTALPSRQRGAIGLMAALTMGLALLCTLTVIDSGRLYLEKRSLQRVADIAALEAAHVEGRAAARRPRRPISPVRVLRATVSPRIPMAAPW